MTVAVPAGEVMAVAAREVGTRESPPGSNRGPRVGEYQASTSLGGTGWPWCAAFVTWVLARAGVETSWCSASTWLMWSAARDRGLTITAPVPGCVIIWPGVHVGLVDAVHGNGTVSTIEGNSGDMVARRTRSVTAPVWDSAAGRWVEPRFIMPAGVVASPARRLYWLEDRVARRRLRVVGPWRTRVMADRARARLSPEWQRRAVVKRRGDGRFVIAIGLPAVRGPWHREADRDRARVKLEAALGRRLRPYSTPAGGVRGPAGAADEMGKTT